MLCDLFEIINNKSDMKLDKQKDTKSKEKQDLAKSTQNLVYLISPLD